MNFGCPETSLGIEDWKTYYVHQEPTSSAWRSLHLRAMNIFLFTDDSSHEVSFLEYKEMLLV